METTQNLPVAAAYNNLVPVTGSEVLKARQDLADLITVDLLKEYLYTGSGYTDISAEGVNVIAALGGISVVDTILMDETDEYFEFKAIAVNFKIGRVYTALRRQSKFFPDKWDDDGVLLPRKVNPHAHATGGTRANRAAQQGHLPVQKIKNRLQKIAGDKPVSDDWDEEQHGGNVPAGESTPTNGGNGNGIENEFNLNFDKDGVAQSNKAFTSAWNSERKEELKKLGYRSFKKGEDWCVGNNRLKNAKGNGEPQNGNGNGAKEKPELQKRREQFFAKCGEEKHKELILKAYSSSERFKEKIYEKFEVESRADMDIDQWQCMIDGLEFHASSFSAFMDFMNTPYKPPLKPETDADMAQQGDTVNEDDIPF